MTFSSGLDGGFLVTSVWRHGGYLYVLYTGDSGATIGNLLTLAPDMFAPDM